MQRIPGRTKALTSALLALLLVTAPACGGGGGGAGPDGAGQGLVLVSFLQNGVGNLSLNQILEFRFSEAVDPSSVTVASLQVREGPSFGAAVAGELRVVGSTVYFEPELPGLCDLSDAGFKPDTQYRITLVGYPEQFSIKNTQGQPLKNTQNFELHSRPEGDPLLFVDQVAGSLPSVTSATPQSGTPVVLVQTDPNQPNEIVLELSENVQPCSISENTVRFSEYQRGDPTRFLNDPSTGRKSGFSPIADADIPNPFSWGPLDAGETSLATPQRIRTILTLEQDFAGTRLRVRPEFGQFPENALCVLELTFGIRDFGGNSFVPYTLTFTTENRTGLTGVYDVLFTRPSPEAEVNTPALMLSDTTADVATDRSPGRAQGWLIFNGDGDNGANQLSPAGPGLPPACTVPRQPNDDTLDNFDPAADVNLDTGLTPNTCPNAVDGSMAVVWEFETFRIRSGRVVRVIGVNPALFQVRQSAQIDSGARLLGRGDGINGTATADGGASQAADVAPAGGRGYAGGGSGGNGYSVRTTVTYADSGVSGYGSPSGYGVVGGTGAGGGGANATGSSFGNSGNSNGGGGGGHSVAGTNGGDVPFSNNPFDGAAMGTGGVAYPTLPAGPAMHRMLNPSAGSGGGGSGHNHNINATYQTNYFYYSASGAGGGAGGGFIDLTAGSGIRIAGEVNVNGGRGGNGAAGFYFASSGAGGGSGGGIRLLTPADIDITGATLTASGGSGGSAVKCGYDVTYNGNPTLNRGGDGGLGRLVMEDGDSVITGQTGATALIPNEGDVGFVRGVFDATRFVGGLTPQVVSQVFLVCPVNPTFVPPVSSDFLASIPAGAERGPGKCAILVEAKGYNLLPDSSADLLTPTGWYTVGYFADSGVAAAPTWLPGVNPAPADVPTLPPGNVGAGLTNLNGREFFQIRITFYLPANIGAFDPGPILDNWTIRFSYDQ
jgi:hypothetical protein